MNSIDKLLAIPNSELAQVLRFSLHGLHATLQVALQALPEDVGQAVSHELLQELEQRLTLSSTWDSVLEPAKPDSSLILAPDRPLQALYDEFQGSRALEPYLGQVHLHSTEDAALWTEIQHLLLRVPAAIAQDWQDRVQHLVQVSGARSDGAALLHALPWIAPSAADPTPTGTTVVYPGLSGSVQAAGLGLSPSVPIEPQLDLESTSDDLVTLAKIVTICLHFAEQPDPMLHHALQSLDSFGLKPLTLMQERRKYVNALLDRFKRVQIAEKSQDVFAIFSARLDLDEAIHSLVYLPPVDRDTSWWGKLQQSARRTLMVKARQYNIQVRALWGSYAEVRKWSKNDLEIDIGGIQGEVSACLRVYIKVNGDALPGRVIFRSSR